jgi:SAM-dependent methyltransferase
MSGFVYEGSELAVFARATRWKRYWGAQLSPYLRGRVLEVGAGVGANIACILGPDVESWVSLEPDAELARQIRFPDGLAGETRVGGLTDLRGDERFDAVLYADVLEHIEDDRAEAARAAAHLNEGGCLLALAPAYPFLYSAFDQAIGHYRRYTKQSLRELTPAGTELVRLRYLDSAGTALSLANRLLLRRSAPAQAQIDFWDRTVVPVSAVLDRWLGFRFGKSVLAIWRKNGAR